jgi:hypothetical protein
LDGSRVTLFEYIAIAFSMVISFTALRALSGVPHAIQAGKRYWVHLAWLVSTLASVLLTFWIFWWNRGVEWNFITFALVLVPPCLLYVFVSLLVPEDSSAVTSWKEHFFKVRIRLFVTGVVWDITAFIGATLTSGVGDLPSSAFVVLPALFVTHSVGALSSKPEVHAVLVAVPPAVIAISALTVFFQPTQ